MRERDTHGLCNNIGCAAQQRRRYSFSGRVHRSSCADPKSLCPIFFLERCFSTLLHKALSPKPMMCGHHQDCLDRPLSEHAASRDGQEKSEQISGRMKRCLSIFRQLQGLLPATPVPVVGRRRMHHCLRTAPHMRTQGIGPRDGCQVPTC